MADEFLQRSVHDEYVERMNTEVKRLADEDNRQNNRIDKLEKQQEHITELTISVKELALEVKNMVSEIASQNTRIQTLESRDGEKWRGAVKTVITVVLTAAVTAALAFLGLK